TARDLLAAPGAGGTLVSGPDPSPTPRSDRHVTAETARMPHRTDSSAGSGPGGADVLGRVAAEVERQGERLRSLRRDVHQHPELAWQELRTTSLVADVLDDAGVTVRALPGSGLVADLGSPEPRMRVALRADLDALPLEESTGLPFASRNPGVCHAC